MDNIDFALDGPKCLNSKCLAGAKGCRVTNRDLACISLYNLSSQSISIYNTLRTYFLYSTSPLTWK